MSFRVLLSTPDVGEVEQAYVLRAMKSGWVAPAGPDLDFFEQEIARRLNRQYAVALSSGTAALHLALVSWGVGPGDFIPVSTLTFAATVNAILYTGAVPHFVDSERESGNMNPVLLDEAVTSLRAAGRSVPCVVTVDLLGKCVNHAALDKIAKRHGFKILADAAESFGASRDGWPAGGFGDAAVLSFNGNKVMTTSGGGMLLTDDERMAQHVRKLSTQAREPATHYEHTEVGYNYRLSNVLAALGRAQLTRLDEMIARRRGWRKQYRRLLADSPGIRVLGGEADHEDNCWLTALVVEPEASVVTAAELHHHFADAGIETRPLWKPMHRQPVHWHRQSTLDGTSDALFNKGLTLPSGSAMSAFEFSLVTEVLERVGS
jgi:dTDP-4-amino-4,6-dideoxygalactose transaminase